MFRYRAVNLGWSRFRAPRPAHALSLRTARAGPPTARVHRGAHNGSGIDPPSPRIAAPPGGRPQGRGVLVSGNFGTALRSPLRRASRWNSGMHQRTQIMRRTRPRELPHGSVLHPIVDAEGLPNGELPGYCDDTGEFPGETRLGDEIMRSVRTHHPLGVRTDRMISSPSL